MAKVHDAAALALYKQTLSCWKFTGYILWKRVPFEWVRAELRGVTTECINEMMHNHVAAGGDLKQKIERRAEFTEHQFFYEVILPINNRRIYVESILLQDDDPDPTIRVVSVHDAN